MKKIINSVLLLLIIIVAANAQELPENYRVELIDKGFQFLEGPVWRDGAILFSDIPANTVYRWHPDSGRSVYLKPSGNSNGLALDSEGNLLLAQHGNRRVSRLDDKKLEESLASHYNGKRLNSPNDIAVKSDGSIFFTDPPYGVSSGEEELGFYGIYRLSLKGEVQLLDLSLNRPNGIVFSPDESKLYVSDSEERKIYVWDVLNDSLITAKRFFAFMDAEGYTDGMKVDKNGNIFATGPYGVWVYDPNGNVMDTIFVPGQTTNCNWGGEDSNTLYVTSGSALYRVVEVSTDINRAGKAKIKHRSFELYDNYPNPFNGTTYIPCQLSQSERVKISILNCAGEHISTIVDQLFTPGHHRVLWQAEDVSSGVYFAQMDTGEGTAIKKCILIK